MPCQLETYPTRLIAGAAMLPPGFADDELQTSKAARNRPSGLVYRSAVMRRVHSLIRRVASCEVTILVEGETGTGKELVARAIHDHSARRQQAFLTQNAGALPDTLIESELFGHRRGAFTGASEARDGIFEAASGGSVFLDEIGEASSALQVRLLRLLETGSYRKLGENRDRTTDVRIIAATHRDLAQEVEAGKFREDLYYRLCIFPIRLPPLRERREDIPLLVEHFVEKANRDMGTEVEIISSGTMEHLSSLPWRGNVRELKNTVQRLVVLSNGKALAEPDSVFPPKALQQRPWTPTSSNELRPLAEIERDYIGKVLAHAEGNQSEAARILGLKRGTLRGKLKKLGMA